MILCDDRGVTTRRPMIPLALALLAGCASTTGPGAAADVFTPVDVVDAVVPPDLVDARADVPARDIGPVECRAAADCDGFSGFPSFCNFGQQRAVSCVAGRCVLGCGAALTCEREADGCVRCSDGTTTCPGQPCAAPFALAEGQVEMALCARAYTRDIVACFGGFVQLRYGEHCLVLPYGSGVPRALLACGPCQIVLRWP